MTQTQLKGEEVEEGGLSACWWLELRPKEPSGFEFGAVLSVDPEHSYNRSSFETSRNFVGIQRSDSQRRQ